MNVRKRGLALLMCICMIFTLLPFSALADSTGNGNGEAGTGEPAGAPVTEPPVTEPPEPAVKVLYVDAKKGNDTTGNGTKENPCKTVGKALEQTDNNGTYTIYLGAGEYSSYETKVAEGKNLTLTFIGDSTGTTVYKMGTSEAGKNGEDGDYSLQGNNKVTFEKMTLLSSVTPSGKMVTRNYTGFIRIQHIVVNNCVVEGRATYWGYTDTEFNNTTFYAPGHEALNSELLLGADNKTDYSLWTGTGTNYTFNHCIFNSNGKSILVYRDGTELNKNVTINIQDCTVVSSAPSKSVMNIDDSNMGSFKYTLNITGNNVVKGLDASSITCSRLFGFSSKANNTGKTDVNFGETTVWKDGKMVDADAYHTSGVMAEGVSYTNGVEGSNNSLYTDGYKDNAFTVEKNGNTVTKTCKYCGWKETKQDWNINVSKTATNLKKDANGDYKTNVTLSVPGVEKNLNSDVVFVLDTSDCVGSVMDQVKTLVEKLNTLSSEKKVNIKVGVVAFKGSAAAMFDGELVSVDKAVEDLNKMIADVAAVNTKDEKEAAVVKYLNDNEDFIIKGSNLHSGLLAAQKLLDGDKEVDNDRKYLITVTDALTYYWNDDQGNVYGIYCGTASENTWGAELLFNQWGPAFGVDTNSGTWKISSDSPIKNWDNYIENVRSRITADNDVYTANVRKAMTDLNLSASAVRLIPRDKMGDFNTAGYSCIPNTELKTHAHGIERSIVACIDTYKQLVTSDYNCYVVNTSTNEFPALVTSELNKLAGQNATIDFNTIENKILYAVDKDSYVVDVIGDDFTLDQDNSLNVGICKIKEDGTKEVTYLKSYKTDPDADGNWTQYFGDSDAATVLMEHYRFKVDYDAASKTLTWIFNERVSNFAPVQLSYTLKLTKPETKPGTYGQLDLNGNGYIEDKDGKDTETKVDPEKALYTNKSATLTPVDSNGKEGVNKDFPKPSVEYTVRNPYRPPVNPGIGDEIIVEITGNSDSVVYDGTEHSVKDYTVKISDPRYTEKDFTFTGKAEASGVNAGTYEMGLKAEQFKNTNARFTNVKFVIKADGVLTITPKELIITAGSKTEYGPTPVTCDEWTVSGLAAGDKVESVKITGIQSVPGSSPNVPSDAVIKNAKGEDVTKNYAIKYVNGTLTMLEVLNKEDHFNYIIGTPEGLSLPTANVTRAEVATIFFRLMTDDARAKFDSLDNNFSDVAKGQWYNRAISTLANAGIIKGDPAGTYRPGDPITRAEMATIIARFGDFKEGGKTFNDISGHWAQKYIELAASNGWINGNPDGTFKPNNNITRAETVAMINRVLDRQTKDVSDLLPVSQMTNWSDNANTAAWYYRDMQEATNNHKAERVGDSIYEKWTEKLPDIDWASYQI